jgi:hypothetical protein
MGKLLGGGGKLFAREAEAALAAGEFGDGGGEVGFAEVGPEDRV